MLRVQTENNVVRNSRDEQRRKESNGELNSPVHANTMPITSSGAIGHQRSKGEIEANSEERVMNNIAEEKVSEEKVPDSTTGTSETAIAPTPESPEVRHRKKKFNLFSKFKKNHNAEEDDSNNNNENDKDKKPKQRFTVMSQIRATIFNSWINILLLAAPIGIAVKYAHVNPVAVFVVNFIAIIPLAALLSYATEEIALRVGETLGGLLNASFGYANPAA
jgi:Ca2+:H+ antiporter